MLIAESVGGSLVSPAGLGADSAGIVGIRALQAELKRLAVDLQTPEIDPAEYDGEMTLGTMVALANLASAASSTIGKKTHPVVGEIIDVWGQLRGALTAIPYAGDVIAVVFSPWLIDKVWDGLLAVIKLVPGGGSFASTVKSGVNKIKQGLGAAAGPIALALKTVPRRPPSGGLGLATFRTHRPPVFYDPQVHGQLGQPLGWWNPLDAIQDLASSVGGWISNRISDALGSLSDFAQDAASAIKRGAERAWDYTSAAAQAAWDAASASAQFLYKTFKNYGCALVNNTLLVTVVAAGVGFVASPAASAAVVTGAGAGATACAAIALTEMVVAIITLLSTDMPDPPSSGLPGRKFIGAESNVGQLVSGASRSAPETATKTYTAGLLTGKIKPLVGRKVVVEVKAPFTPPPAPFAGCFVRFNRTRKVYAVYCPPKTAGLAEAPPGTTLVTTVPKLTDAPGATRLPDESDPLYTRPWFWVAIVGGAAAVGGGIYYAKRKG